MEPERNVGAQLNAERILAQAKKIDHKRITHATSTHNIQRRVFSGYAFCAIDRQIRTVREAQMAKGAYKPEHHDPVASGSSIEGERIAGQARKIVEKSHQVQNPQHGRLKLADLIGTAYCVIERPLRFAIRVDRP